MNLIFDTYESFQCTRYAGFFFAAKPCYQDKGHSFSSTCELSSDRHTVSHGSLAKDSVSSADVSMVTTLPLQFSHTMHYEAALWKSMIGLD